MVLGRPRVSLGRYGLTMIDATLIQEAGRRLTQVAPCARVILFGSHARGDADSRSDLDFLVVEPQVERRGEESVRLRRALRGLRRLEAIPAKPASRAWRVLLWPGKKIKASTGGSDFAVRTGRAGLCRPVFVGPALSLPGVVDD
jgi:predicted nucleotidyltransferase